MFKEMPVGVIAAVIAMALFLTYVVVGMARATDRAVDSTVNHFTDSINSTLTVDTEEW